MLLCIFSHLLISQFKNNFLFMYVSFLYRPFLFRPLLWPKQKMASNTLKMAEIYFFSTKSNIITSYLLVLIVFPCFFVSSLQCDLLRIWPRIIIIIVSFVYITCIYYILLINIMILLINTCLYSFNLLILA